MSQSEKKFGLMQGLSPYCGKRIIISLENNEYRSIDKGRN